MARTPSGRCARRVTCHASVIVHHVIRVRRQASRITCHLHARLHESLGHIHGVRDHCRNYPTCKACHIHKTHSLKHKQITHLPHVKHVSHISHMSNILEGKPPPIPSPEIAANTFAAKKRGRLASCCCCCISGTSDPRTSSTMHLLTSRDIPTRHAHASAQLFLHKS